MCGEAAQCSDPVHAGRRIYTMRKSVIDLQIRKPSHSGRRPMPMNLLKRLAFAPFVLALTATALLAQSAADKADAERLIRVLDVRAGSSVAEIGAGNGELSFAMATAVGSTGKVYINDINADRARTIRQAAEKAGYTQVTVVEGHATQTNFPAQCCDAIFMRNVYHHFGDPQAMNASLRDTLKPGGRLAIIDFTPPPLGGEGAPGKRGEDGHHGITAPTLEAELKAAGFEILSSATTKQSVFVVARRPSS